jgi:hypothetical protein
MKIEVIDKGVLSIPSTTLVSLSVDTNVKKAYPIHVHTKIGTYHFVLLFLEESDDTKFDEYITKFANKYGEKLVYITNDMAELVYPII